MAKVTTVRFDDELFDEIQVAMVRRRVPSFKDLVTELLQKWLDDQSQDWKTLSEMAQETTAPLLQTAEFVAGVQHAIAEAVTNSIDARLGFTLVELKSDKLSASGTGETASGGSLALWHELLDRILTSGNQRTQRAVLQLLFSVGELVDITQGRSAEDAKNNPVKTHSDSGNPGPKTTRRIA